MTNKLTHTRIIWNNAEVPVARYWLGLIFDEDDIIAQKFVNWELIVTYFYWPYT